MSLRNRAVVALAPLVLLLSAGPAAAQGLPSEPIVFGNGRVTLGGDMSLTVSCSDASEGSSCGNDTGFFNYTDYEHSTLRLLRLNLSASVRANDVLSILTEVRSDNGTVPQPYALYVRIRPWRDKAFDIQAGRVPPTFGAFSRRAYPNDNILIGYPLAYQYLTALRPDAVPAAADELLRMRGRGWLSSYSLGNLTPDNGLPLVAAFRWDTGLQVHTTVGWADLAGAVTTGSLANPLVVEDNTGRQLAGRVAFRPKAALAVGLSAARAPFLTNAATRSLGISEGRDRFTQSAFGADAEYSGGYYLVRVETIRSTWTLPTIPEPLHALATSIEGRYKLHPRLSVAARLDHLGFSTIAGTTRIETWDAPVTRVEAGVGYLVQRNLQLKFSAQRNQRNGGRVPHLDIGAVQAVWWF